MKDLKNMDKNKRNIAIALMIIVFVALVAYVKPIATGKSNGQELVSMLKYLISGALAVAGYIIGFPLNRAADEFEKRHTVQVIGTVIKNNSRWVESIATYGEYNNENYTPSDGHMRFTPVYEYTAPDGTVHTRIGRDSAHQTPEGTTKAILLDPHNYDDACFPDDLHRTRKLRTRIAIGLFIFAVITFLQFNMFK